MSTVTVLMVVSIVFLILAALNVGSPKFSLGWAGLALWAIATVVR